MTKTNIKQQIVDVIQQLAAYLKKDTEEYIGRDSSYYLTDYRTRRRIKRIGEYIQDTVAGWGREYMLILADKYAPQMSYQDKKAAIIAAYKIERARLVATL